MAFSIALTSMDDVACDAMIGTEWSSSQTSSGGSDSVGEGDDDVCSRNEIVSGDDAESFWRRRPLEDIAAIDCAAVQRNWLIFDVNIVDVLLLMSLSRPSA